MNTDLLKILNDRIDRLNRHGRFEECEITERAREELFPETKSAQKKVGNREEGTD